MARNTILKDIQKLDPKKDHERIVFLSTCYEFSFDTTRALEMALFRTFWVPSISGLLDQTGEFRQRPQKRYDDTDILISGFEAEASTLKRGCRGEGNPTRKLAMYLVKRLCDLMLQGTPGHFGVES